MAFSKQSLGYASAKLKGTKAYARTQFWCGFAFVIAAYHFLPTDQTSACTYATMTILLSSTLHRVRLDYEISNFGILKDHYVHDLRRGLRQKSAGRCTLQQRHPDIM